MADYYPLIARAVSGLEKSTGDARRALYERARTALVAQLRGVTPALPESEITRERLSLEEAIRKVEAEAARRVREEAAAPAPPRREPAPAAPRREPAPAPAPAPAPSPRPATAEPPRMPQPSRAEPRLEPPKRPGPRFEPLADPHADMLRPPQPQQPAARPAPKPQQPAPPPTRAPAPQPAAARSRLADDELRALRGLVEETRAPAPPASAPSGQPPRDPFSGIPAAHDFDRLEPSLEPDKFEVEDYENTPPFQPEAVGHPAPRQRPARDMGEAKPIRRLSPPIGAITKIFFSILLIAGLVGLAYWQRGMIRGLYHALRGQPAAVTRDVAQNQNRPKIADRIGPGASSGPQGAIPAVAQRVVLYEEEANDPEGKRYIGSVIWRTETVTPGPGQAPELAVRADVEIPERKLAMTFSIRRNTDQNLPASHTIEIVFNLPADFAPGGVSNVPGVLMKQAEQTRGVPLAGLAVKVTTGFFLIGLSAVDSDFQRNIALLKERSWFDIPVVYSNNRRAILAIEKGTPGERAFAEAFATWKQ